VLAPYDAADSFGDIIVRADSVRATAEVLAGRFLDAPPRLEIV
jgi:hypothetical protein